MSANRAPAGRAPGRSAGWPKAPFLKTGMTKESAPRDDPRNRRRLHIVVGIARFLLPMTLNYAASHVSKCRVRENPPQEALADKTEGRETRPSFPDASEVQLQAELYFSWIVSSGDLAEISIAEPRTDGVERWVVEKVEELRPELVMKPLCERAVLVEGKVPVAGTRPRHDVAVRGAKSAAGGFGEARRFEKLL